MRCRELKFLHDACKTSISGTDAERTRDFDFIALIADADCATFQGGQTCQSIRAQKMRKLKSPKNLLKFQFCQQYGFFAMRSIKDKIEERSKREGQWREETAPYTRPQYK